MLAIRTINQGCGYNYNIKAWNYTYENLQSATLYKRTYHEIPLETCTAEHFSKIPNIYQNFNQLGLANWVCLPINQSYGIGGSW